MCEFLLFEGTEPFVALTKIARPVNKGRWLAVSIWLTGAAVRDIWILGNWSWPSFLLMRTKYNWFWEPDRRPRPVSPAYIRQKINQPPNQTERPGDGDHSPDGKSFSLISDLYFWSDSDNKVNKATIIRKDFLFWLTSVVLTTKIACVVKEISSMSRWFSVYLFLHLC